MNNKAVRVPSYATYYVLNGTMQIVVELTASLGNKAKCLENDCSEHVICILKNLLLKLNINLLFDCFYSLTTDKKILETF